MRRGEEERDPITRLAGIGFGMFFAVEAPVAPAGGALQGVGEARRHELAAAIDDVPAEAGRVVAEALAVAGGWRVGCGCRSDGGGGAVG